MMKRYLLFSGATYYPAGGWHEFRADFATLDEAIANYTPAEYDWAHIVDTKLLLTDDPIVWTSGGGCGGG
jgi:hypothetical protein